MTEQKSKAWRNDAYAKVTGDAKYTDDLKFSNLLHAAPVYSDFVHAKIESIITGEAEKCPGVVRVLTARDVPGANHCGQIVGDYRIFADDKIRYNGDVVAMVVAESRDIAIRASRLVRVEATPLPAMLDPEQAMGPNAVLVHLNHGSNIIATHQIRRGNMDQGFGEAAFVIEEKFQTQFIEHAYLEPEVAVCVPRPDGVIEVYGSMQHPFSTRRFTAACLDVALSEIEVVGVPMGGGFGGKDGGDCLRAHGAGGQVAQPAGENDVPPRVVHPRKLQAPSLPDLLQDGRDAKRADLGGAVPDHCRCGRLLLGHAVGDVALDGAVLRAVPGGKRALRHLRCLHQQRRDGGDEGLWFAAD